MRLGTVTFDGRRHAARFGDGEVHLLDCPSLDVAIASGIDLGARGRVVREEEVVRDAALRPPVVLCAGQNYRDHLDEKAPVDTSLPEFFMKAGQTIAAPDERFLWDARVTSKLDYETELAFVIGRGGRHVQHERALDHVLGYVVVNDLTARDRQVPVNADGSFGLALGPGKNFDGATRMATELVTADAVPDPQALPISTTVNGEPRQRNTTAAMVHSVADIIVYISALMTLLPGSVIATGTPGGTAWGTDQAIGGTSCTPEGCVPARYLVEGDEVRSVIDGVGELSFVVAS